MKNDREMMIAEPPAKRLECEDSIYAIIENYDFIKVNCSGNCLKCSQKPWCSLCPGATPKPIT